MKLTAKVIDTHSPSQYTDNRRRVTLKIEEADCMNTRLTVRSDDLREDDELVFLVMKTQAAKRLGEDLRDIADDPNTGQSRAAFFGKLADQLRPDGPPPWEQPAQELGVSLVGIDIAEDTRRLRTEIDTTQEFRLGGTA